MKNKPAPVPPEGQLLIYQDGRQRIQVRIDGKTVWLTQRLMAELYQVSVKTVNEHLVNIYAENELDPSATIRKFRIVQTEGTRQVSRMERIRNRCQRAAGSKKEEQAMIEEGKAKLACPYVPGCRQEEIGYGG